MHAAATKVDPVAKKVAIDDARELGYDCLFIATGLAAAIDAPGRHRPRRNPQDRGVLVARAADRRLGLAGFRTGGAARRPARRDRGRGAAGHRGIPCRDRDGVRRQAMAHLRRRKSASCRHVRADRRLPGPDLRTSQRVFIAFLLPFLDIGIAQSPMLRAAPPSWALALPGYGADRVLLDGGLTTTFDQTGRLMLALAWLAALVAVTALVFRPVHGITGVRPRGQDPAVPVDR